MSDKRPSLGRVQRSSRMSDTYSTRRGCKAGQKLCSCQCQDHNTPQEKGGHSCLVRCEKQSNKKNTSNSYSEINHQRIKWKLRKNHSKIFFNGNMFSLYQQKLDKVLKGNKYNTTTYLLGKKKYHRNYYFLLLPPSLKSLPGLSMLSSQGFI